MSEREKGADTNGQPQNDGTWEEVLTSEELELPENASGNTEELVGVVAAEETPPAEARASTAALEDEDDFLGFEETVSVSKDELREAASAVPARVAGPEDVLASRVVPVTATQQAAGEETQVLRRSLLDPGAKAPETVTFEEATATFTTPTAPSAAATAQTSTSFEEAMAAPPAPVVPAPEDTVLPEVPSRALPRFLSVLLTLIFTPITWYLVADAAARLAFADANPMVTGNMNPAAIGELAAGLIGIIIIAILAAQSSLGLIVTGVIVFGVGVPFIVVPGIVSADAYWGLGRFENFNAFGANVVNHFMATGFTGLFIVLGTLMIALGWAIASVRRSGRSEEAQRAAVASSNPSGLKARWARKATEKRH